MTLFVTNYGICQYLYPAMDDLSCDKWWETNSCIYGITIALLLLASTLKERGVLRFILDIGAGFAVSNVIDRMYFNTTQFNKSDYIMIAMTILIAVLDYKKDEHTTNN